MFSETYQQAREAFVNTAIQSGYELKKYVLPNLKGAEGEELSMDVASYMHPLTRKLFIVNSGLHGIEGFYGSAMQTEWLAKHSITSLPPGVGLLFIHASNPYGFSHLRRVNEENMDLNRNFIDFNKPLSANPGYAKLQSAIIPKNWFSRSQQIRANTALGLAKLKDTLTKSRSYFFEPIAGGQYSDSKGIFYGGDHPAWTNGTLQQILAETAASVPSLQQVTFMDLHSGLGKKGTIEAYSGVAESHSVHQRITSWLSNIINIISAPYQVSGPGCYIVPSHFPRAMVTSFGIECGTEPLWTVLNALRADSWLYKYGDDTHPKKDEIKQNIKSAFYPKEKAWRDEITRLSMKIFDAVLHGMVKSQFKVDSQIGEPLLETTI